MKITTIQDLLKNSYKKNKKSNIDGYILDHELSGTRAQVYKNNDNKAVIVHRGTKGVQDVITDGLYGLTGYKTNRFKHAEKVQKQAYDKYGKENTSSLGHSLGSLINNEVGKDAKQTINYNTPMVSIQDLLKGNKENHYEIRSTNDPFNYPRNLLPTRKNETLITNPSLNPLKAHSTNDLSKLNSSLEVGQGIYKKR